MNPQNLRRLRALPLLALVFVWSAAAHDAAPTIYLTVEEKAALVNGIPAPPQAGSDQDKADLAAVLKAQEARTPEQIAEIKHPKFTATLFDLLTAYAAQRQQRVLASVHLAKRTVWSLAEARASLERLVGIAEDWSNLDSYLMSFVVDPTQRATVFASSFAAALELVREGQVDLQQKQAFAPIYFRKRPPQPASDVMSATELPAG